MNDVIFAGFAQFSYLNWHKLSNTYKGYKLTDIFQKDIVFNKIKTNEYSTYSGPNYSLKDTGLSKQNIYSCLDARLFYVYSEDRGNAEKNPKYPDFRDWQFVYGYDHLKILEEMTSKKEEITLSNITCGFQSGVFMKGKDIIISYRGSDSYSEANHILTDWLNTNFLIGISVLPEAITCAIWLYKKVVKDYSNYNIYITGHSMGGALALYATLYDGLKKVKKTVTWNGLGIIDPEETTVWGKIANSYFPQMKSNYFKIKDSEKIINYNYSKDVVGSLRNNIGKSFSVDTCTTNNVSLLKKHSKLIESIMNALISNQIWKIVHKEKLSKSDIVKWILIDHNKKIRVIEEIYNINKNDLLKNLLNDFNKGNYNLAKYHQLNNFLPFFENGNINRSGKINNNFLMNSFKIAVIDGVSLNIFNPSTKGSAISISKKKCYIPKIAKNQKNIKMGDDIYNLAIKNESNLLNNRIEKSFSKDNVNWYNPLIPEVGLFNNINKIAGILGGDPYNLNNIIASSKSYDAIILCEGNYIIRSV